MAERHRAGCCGRAGLRLRGCRVPGLAEDQQDSRVLVPTAAQRFASQFRFSWLGLRRHFCSELRFAEASVVRHGFAGAGFFGVKQGGKKLGRKEAAVGGHSGRGVLACQQERAALPACLPLASLPAPALSPHPLPPLCPRGTILAQRDCQKHAATRPKLTRLLAAEDHVCSAHLWALGFRDDSLQTGIATCPVGCLCNTRSRGLPVFMQTLLLQTTNLL